MTLESRSSPSRRLGRSRDGVVLLVILLTGLGIFFIQKAVLTRVTGGVLPLLAASAGLELHWNHLQVDLFAPMTIEGVRIRTISPGSGETSISIGKAVLEFSSLWSWLKGQQRFFNRLEIYEFRGVVDFRSPATPPPSLPITRRGELSKAILKGETGYLLAILPLALEIRAPDLNFLFDGITYRLRNFSTSLSDDSLGSIQYSFAKVETPLFEKLFPASSALATWRSGTLVLADWTLFPDWIIESLSINFVNPEGLGMACDMAVFGGTVKGDLLMKTRQERPDWDAAFVAQQVKLGPLAKIFNKGASVQGVLKEGKLTFRGQPTNIADAEGAIRVNIDGFSWNDLGWQTLEFGADMINHRIAIPEFRLSQKENLLRFNGSASIPKSLRDLSKTAFEFSVAGNFQDLEALAGLLGPKFHQLHGRMTLDGSLWSSPEGPNGYFKLEASSIQFRKVQFTTARVNSLFRNGNVEIAACELWNGEDFFSTHGIVDLNAAHQYSGEVRLHARDIALYNSLFGENWNKQLRSGAVSLTWQGDGTFNRHSGAFSLQVGDLVSMATPAGVSGKFEGTFSPGYIYFNRCELFRNAMRLTTQISLSKFGATIEALQLTEGARGLAEGSAFLPVDFPALASGTPWKSALRSDKPIYLYLNSEKVKLEELCHLMGQKVSLSGLAQCNLFAAGFASSLNLNGQLQADALSGSWNGRVLPPSRVRIQIQAAHGNATLAANLFSQRAGGIWASASLPLNFSEDSKSWLDSSKPLNANLHAERLNLAALNPLFPKISSLAGRGSINLSLKNTLSDPKVDGQFTLSGGAFKVTPNAPGVSGLQIAMILREGHLSLDTLRGKLGSGAFSMSGGVDFSPPDGPRYDLRFTGERMLLHEDPNLTLQAGVRLLAQGTPVAGKISGAIHLQNGELRRRLEIISAQSSSVSAQAEEPFSWEKIVPSPFARWGLDISVSNDTPFLVKTQLMRGEIIPHLRFGGSLGRVVPSGSVELKNMRAFFPFAVAEIPTGLISFDSSHPWQPILDVRGSANVAGYAIQMAALGPLAQPSLIFASEPLLSQQSILFLLNTGQPLWKETMDPYLPQVAFPFQAPRTFAKQTMPLIGANLKIRIPENHSLVGSWNPYEFPGAQLGYFFKLK